MIRYRLFLLITVFGAGAAWAQTKDRPEQPDLPGDLMLDFGFSTWSEQPDLLPLNIIGSNSFGIYYNKRYRISDRLSFHPAVGFAFNKYAFEDNFTWLMDGSGNVSLDTLSGITLTKNKLAVNYFEFPVELRIYPLKTVNGEGWFIGLGGFAGARIGAHTKIKYVTSVTTTKEKLYRGFDLNAYDYGYQIRFGFRSVHLFYKVHLSDVFRDSPDDSGKNPRTTTFGINISGF